MGECERQIQFALLVMWVDFMFVIRSSCYEWFDDDCNLCIKYEEMENFMNAPQVDLKTLSFSDYSLTSKHHEKLQFHFNALC